MDDESYAQLNKAWKQTCKVLLKEEVGDLLEFRSYLVEYIERLERRKSAISDADVILSSGRFATAARVISNAPSERAEYEKKMSALPLDINKIKDIDSIIELAQERAYYAGNIVLGNSSRVFDSHRCVNTNLALECLDVYEGKNVAYTTSIRMPEYSFGCCIGGEIQFCIKVFDPYKLTRCFETFRCYVDSDCYYCGSLEDCTNCLFSFNQKNKHNLIGNVQLSKERHAELKTKLVGEIAESLKRNKRAPSIIDILCGGNKGTRGAIG